MFRIFSEHGLTLVEFGPKYDSLDESAVYAVGDQLLEVASTADPPLLVFDLSETKYIGSHFIEILLRASKRLSERQGRLVLCGLSPSCAEVLHFTRLDDLWENVATREDAKAAVCG